MTNPWTKKNPLMSMWLSGANTVLGAARGHATAAAKRQATTLATQITKDVLNLWAPAPKPPSKAKRRR